MGANGEEVAIATTAKTPLIRGFIDGIPYGKSKVKGDTHALERWTNAVKLQTADWPKVQEACAMNVTFLLPDNKFRADFPYGNDLDNLLKRFFDALKETIFSIAPGGDSCVVVLHVMKTKVPEDGKPGAAVEILPISVV